MKYAKFYLQHQGQRGTDKQCEKILKQLGEETIKRMAIERGYKE